MDFYHVLPSNVSPTYFPNNHASKYSTPLDVPYDLNGEWELAVMNLTYSTCVNTFNNDKIIIQERCTVAECVKSVENPLKVMLPLPTTTNDVVLARENLMTHINKAFDSLLNLKMYKDHSKCEWVLKNKDFYYILSPTIKYLFQLWSDVLTDADDGYANYYTFYGGHAPTNPDELWIIIVSAKAASHEAYTTFTIKKKTEDITNEEMLKRFNENVTPGVINMTLQKGGKFVMEKLKNDNKLVVVNKRLRRALTYRRSAMFGPGKQQYQGAWHGDVKDDDWILTIITLKEIVIFNPMITKIVTLSPCSFEKEDAAISLVNKKVNDSRIMFTCNSKKQISLQISTLNLTVIFSNALRDIFAFEKNIYSGPITYIASGAFSLTRCIQYLYIYSNLGSNVRIGNTEAPLLAIVPFLDEKDCNLLTEKVFKNPMYIHVKQNRVSQIDVSINDGAGDLVPFVSDAVTTLRLHFRQI